MNIHLVLILYILWQYGFAVKLDPDDFSYDPLNEFMYEFGKWDPDFVPTDLKGNYSIFGGFVLGKMVFMPKMI